MSNLQQVLRNLRQRNQQQQADSAVSSSPVESQQTISDSSNERLATNLVHRYLTTSLSFSDYKLIAEWLGCYRYECKPLNKRMLETEDRRILEYLVNHTQLTVTEIYHKLIFLKDLHYGLKTTTTKLFISPDISQLP